MRKGGLKEEAGGREGGQREGEKGREEEEEEEERKGSLFGKREKDDQTMEEYVH